MSAAQSPSPDPFSITAEPDRDEVAVVVAGDLDLATADALEQEVRTLRRAGFERVLIDLRDVGFLDSTGLRVLLALRNDAKRDGSQLAVVPGPREVQRVFELTATRGLFDWREP